MAKPKAATRLGNIGGLINVKWRRRGGGLHSAEAAAARARVAHQHDGRRGGVPVAAAPALADVRAARLPNKQQ